MRPFRPRTSRDAPPPRPRWLRTPFLGLVAVLGLLASPLSAITGEGPAAADAGKPNVLIILTDDMRMGSLFPMTTVKSDLEEKGVYFKRGYVVNPLCCPSRTSILTGDYSHTTGIWRDTPPFGGYQTFAQPSQFGPGQNDTIATKLQAAGYRTGLFGKYLNGYWTAAQDGGAVPPGWNQWMAFPRAGYTNFDLDVNGTIHHYDQGQYSTTVLGNAAATFIRNTPGPSFTYFAPYAPHNPATPETKWIGHFNAPPVNRSPAYNEKNVSDKPAYIQARKRFSGEQKAQIDAFRVKQLESLKSVDTSVATILKALQDTGKLNNTLIFFLSDNGIEWGEHRWRSKRVPYEESVQVPYIVRYDPLTSHASRIDTTHLALNIDIAPTIEQVAGIAPTPMDGRSLVPLLSAPSAPWRTKFLIDHLPRRDGQDPPAYCAVHTLDYIYVYYATGEEELYNLQKDPDETLNVVTDPHYAAIRSKLRGALKHMCQPPPPGMALPGG